MESVITFVFKNIYVILRRYIHMYLIVHICACIQVHSHATAHAEVRGQFVGTSSLHLPVGPGDQMQVIRLVGRCRSQLSHLSDLLSWTLIQRDGVL